MFNYHTMIEENWYIVTNLIFKKKIKRFYQIENHKINFVRVTGTNMKKNIF